MSPRSTLARQTLSGDDLDFYLRRFVSGWYRGSAHFGSDVQRFCAAYRIGEPLRGAFARQARRAVEAAATR
jgi:hypothetical protein